jgi:hypothetical protein
MRISSTNAIEGGRVLLRSAGSRPPPPATLRGSPCTRTGGSLFYAMIPTTPNAFPADLLNLHVAAPGWSRLAFHAIR